jgi:hypothetical protein
MVVFIHLVCAQIILHVLFATADGKAFPNVVWEISYLNEDENTLIQELLLWISPLTSVQVAIGIKILDMRSKHGANDCIHVQKTTARSTKSSCIGALP